MVNKKRSIGEYKKIIDNDFTIFPINKRLIELERSWAVNISHIVYPRYGKYVGGYYQHVDREDLRNELFAYIEKKVKEVKEKEIPQILNKSSI